MDRHPRPPIPALELPAARRKVRAWMRLHAAEYETATSLAEGANAALSLPHGALDDECHWIWDEAVSAINRTER